MTFAKLYDQILLDDRLSNSTKVLHARLVQLIFRQGLNSYSWQGTQATLAKKMDLTVRQINRLISQLKRCNYLDVVRGGDDKPATYVIHKNVLSENQTYTKMSYPKFSNLHKNVLSEKNVHVPTSRDSRTSKTGRRALELRDLNNSNSNLGKGSAEGKTSCWPADVVAKFKKIIGQPPNAAFRHWQAETISDYLDYLAWKIDRGAEIREPAGWLIEALRSGYLQQRKIRGFKTAREKSSEESSQRQEQIANRRQGQDAETLNFIRKIVADHFAQTDAALIAKLKAEASEIIAGNGQGIDPESRIGEKLLSATMFSMACDYVVSGGKFKPPKDHRVIAYLETLKQRINGNRGP